MSAALPLPKPSEVVAEYTLPPGVQVDYDRLVTEDDTPVDGVYSERQMRLLASTLYDSWPGPGRGRTFLALANVGLFYAHHLPPIVPDFLLSLDVAPPTDAHPKKNRSYFLWRYGKAPELALEIVSNDEGEELGRKVEIYATIGILYYVVWDPEQILGEEMYHAFVLKNKEYRKHGTWFPKIGLGLQEWQGTYEGLDEVWLRRCDKKGRLLATGAELAARQQQRAVRARKRAEQERQRAEQERQRAEQERQRADEESQRAEQERQRAEQERLRAEQERERAERLAAQLRALGIEAPGE